MDSVGGARGTALSERTLRTIVGALGIFHVLLGLYQLLAPASFFARIGAYGLENTHYVGDVGSFTLALGIALLLAVGRPSWRGPVLYLAAIWYAIHAANHLLDIDEAQSTARGVADTLLIALGAGLLAWLGSAAQRGAAAEGGPSPAQERPGG